MDGYLERLQHRPLRLHVMGGLLTLSTLAAMVGGGLLLADPTGTLLGMSAADLGTAPFANYTIPGAVLLVAFGLLPIPVLFGLWHEKAWAMNLGGIIGLGLVVWITSQVIWFGGVASPVQPLVWLEGMALMAIAGVPRWNDHP